MRRLSLVDPDEVAAAAREAASVVAGGGVLLMPTESFYGLGADPMRADAVDRICRMKGRGREHGLPVVCADWQQLESLVVVPDIFRARLSCRWPAALTAVLQAKPKVPAAVNGTLAVRIPAHDVLRALLYIVGPLTATSSNRHSEPPGVTVDEALRSLDGEPDLVLDGGETAGGLPSTLVDLTGDSPQVLRSGPCLLEDPLPDS
jgi:L-threonylcarbamoyladenylate synthase